MPMRLRDNVHWCDCRGRVVFLDAEAGRYFCLPKGPNDAFLRWASGDSQPEDAARLRPLLGHGILIEVPGPSAARSPAHIEPVTDDYMAGPFSWSDLPHIFRALASEMRISWSLRTKPIRLVINTARNRRRAPKRMSCNPERSLQGIVTAAKTTALLTRAHDRCLVRALAVHAECKRIGLETKLVFGIIAQPFAAHSWVQLGSTVLVGGFEQARLFTPILVVE